MVQESWRMSQFEYLHERMNKVRDNRPTGLLVLSTNTDKTRIESRNAIVIKKRRVALRIPWSGVWLRYAAEAYGGALSIELISMMKRRI